MKINRPEGNTPFHGRMENKKSQEDTALAKAVLRRPTAPDELTFSAVPGSNASVNHVAQIIFGRAG